MTLHVAQCCDALKNNEPVRLVHNVYADQPRHALIVRLPSLSQVHVQTCLIGLEAVLVLPHSGSNLIDTAPYPKESWILNKTILQQLSKEGGYSQIEGASHFIAHPAGIQSQYHMPHMAAELFALAEINEPFLLVNLPSDDEDHETYINSISVLSSEDIAKAIVDTSKLVEKVSSAYVSIPEKVEGAKLTVYHDASKTLEYVLLDFSKDGAVSADRWVRLHSSCLTGDIFQSLHCDCGLQLKKSLALCAKHDGLLLYLPQEGRGLGLAQKMKAYQLQNEGHDTVNANLLLGHDADERFFGAAVQILKDQGVTSCRLMTNNPNKVSQLSELGLSCRMVEDFFVDLQSDKQKKYLEVKHARLQHKKEER